MLNLSFLIDYVMEEVKPLNWDGVLSSPIPLKVGSLSPAPLAVTECLLVGARSTWCDRGPHLTVNARHCCLWVACHLSASQ